MQKAYPTVYTSRNIVLQYSKHKKFDHRAYYAIYQTPINLKTIFSEKNV